MADEATAEVQATEGGEPLVGEAGAEPADAALLSAIGLLSPEDAATEAEKPADGEAEAEKPAEDAKPKKKTRAEFEAFLMSEGELAKPDGLKKAADYWRGRQKKLDGIDVRMSQRGAELDERERVINSAYEEKQRELDGARAYARKLGALRERLLNPKDIPDRLDAIGELLERPGQGREVWDSWAKWAIAGGKRQEANGEIAALKAEVARLGEMLQKQPEESRRAAEEAEEARLSAVVEGKEKEFFDTFPAEKYPAIADKLGLETWRRGLLNDVKKLRRDAKAKGQPLDLAGALSIINAALLKTQGSPAGAKPAAPASATPASPVAARATSIAPSQARSMPVVREKTQEERDRDLASDTDYLASIGLM